MEQRLGKTFTLIKHIASHRALYARSVLVVCPNSVKATWASELDQENETDYIVIEGTRKQREKALQQNHKYIIVNYESVELLKLHLYDWSSVILDESIYIANPKAKRTKYLLNNFLHVKYKFVLCGQPAPESMLQYVTQIQFVLGNFMGYNSYWSFRAENFNNVMYKWIPHTGLKKQVYKYLRQNAFILSRIDANIGSKKLYQTLRVPLTSSQRKSYNSMYSEFEADDVSTKYAPVKYLYMHKIAGGVNLDMKRWHSLEKFNMVIELLQQELQGQQVLIWFRYKHEIKKFAEMLDDTSLTYLKIDGDTPVISRNLLRMDFWRKKYNVALMTIKSMRTGTDWSCANTSIYFSNEFSWDLRSQSEDRIIHPKNKQPKLVIDVCTDKTVDFDIVELLKGKKVDSGFFMSSLYEKILARGCI